MAEQSDMNALLRKAAFGLSEDAMEAGLADRRKSKPVTDMNRLLRAARGRSITEKEADTDAAE